MNVSDYTYLMNKPDAITEKQADALGSVLNEFPYFQSARALRLKGLYNQNSFKYNYALKVTAAHTADRSVLFDFITSEAFTSIQNDFYEQKLRDLLEITVFDSEIISPEQIQKAIEIKTDLEEQPVSETIKEAPISSIETPSVTKIEEPIKTQEPLKAEEPVIIEEPKKVPEIDPSIFLAIKEAHSVTFEKPVIIEEPKKLPEIDPSIFLAIKEAHSITFEKPVIETENKIDSTDSISNIEKEEETEILAEETEEETIITEEPKIDRIENSILSSIKVAETPSVTEPIRFEEPKNERVENSILNSIKESEAATIEQSAKAEEIKTEPIVEQPILNSIEEEEDDSVIEEMIIPEFKMNSVERSILSSIKEAETKAPEEPKEEILEVLQSEDKEEEEIQEENEEPIEEIIEEEEPNEPAKTAAEHLEIGKPLDFSLSEKHSFQEWLQLSRTEPIDRSNELSPEEQAKIEAAKEEERQKKAEIIDKFIETNPKISPIKPGTSAPVVQIEPPVEDNSYLMTETLARVYLEQKKYTKAIQAYEILILKYPEKITFFADRISDIKILQQNNNNNN
ncbi:MAG: tetratricopeptide repeat protein [Flavobacterium nitrogenifigens]|uniref:tetratricopeptide repeat protein n=1 Tax=Flavobacterium nitrogenifigens TaxID=1617283 RepID=UPI00280A31D1|nr:tetratricopeptide repeat protein [Flavobacterium nitrogenifigens]MDQ8011626.1 tetratricopeptide repeat protein [Flavobacterium nitrogenifigens]